MQDARPPACGPSPRVCGSDFEVGRISTRFPRGATFNIVCPEDPASLKDGPQTMLKMAPPPHVAPPTRIQGSGRKVQGPPTQPAQGAHRSHRLTQMQDAGPRYERRDARFRPKERSSLHHVIPTEGAKRRSGGICGLFAGIRCPLPPQISRLGRRPRSK